MIDLLRWWLSPGHGDSPWAVGFVLGFCLLVALVLFVWLWVVQSVRLLALVAVAIAVWRWVRGQLPQGGAGGTALASWARWGRGHSLLYRYVMQSGSWRRRRQVALWRAGHRCQRCGARGRLEVHHLHYGTLGFERPQDVTVLCKPCHAAAHQQVRAA